MTLLPIGYNGRGIMDGENYEIRLNLQEYLFYSHTWEKTKFIIIISKKSSAQIEQFMVSGRGFCVWCQYDQIMKMYEVIENLLFFFQIYLKKQLNECKYDVLEILYQNYVVKFIAPPWFGCC